MPPEYQQNPIGVALPATEARVYPKAITRKRFMELVDIADVIAGELDKLGLQKDEYCTFGELMSRFINLPKEGV